MSRFIQSFSIIFLGLALGFLFKKLIVAGAIRLDEDAANSIQLASNGALVLIVPLLAILLPLLG